MLCVQLREGVVLVLPAGGVIKRGLAGFVESCNILNLCAGCWSHRFQ